MQDARLSACPSRICINCNMRHYAPNAGTVGHRILRRRTSEFHIRSANRSILATTGSVSSSSRIDAN